MGAKRRQKRWVGGGGGDPLATISVVSGVVNVSGKMAVSIRGRPIRSIRMRGETDWFPWTIGICDYCKMMLCYCAEFEPICIWRIIYVWTLH